MNILDNLPEDDKEILGKTLVAIRDKYPLYIEAVTFLESKVGLKATQALCNIRDTLSHLSSALLVTSTSSSHARLDHLNEVNEHFRRAIIEPYELAVNVRLVELKDLFDIYLKTSAPVTYKVKPPPKPIDEFKGRINSIISLTRQGRAAKGENGWTPKWEEGIKTLERAFEESDKLRDEMRAEISRVDGAVKTRIYFAIGILATIAFGIIGIFSLIA